MHGGPHLNVYDVIPFVQIQRHRHVIERRIGRDRNTEALRKINGKSPWNEGEKSPVEVRLPAHLLIVFGRAAAAFSESEIGMTEKLLRNWLSPGRIEDLSFESSYPLHARFFRHAEVDSTLYRPGSLHGAVNFVQSIRIGHERQNRFLLRIRPSQRIDRRHNERAREGKKAERPVHAFLFGANDMPIIPRQHRYPAHCRVCLILSPFCRRAATW